MAYRPPSLLGGTGASSRPGSGVSSRPTANYFGLLRDYNRPNKLTGEQIANNVGNYNPRPMNTGQGPTRENAQKLRASSPTYGSGYSYGSGTNTSGFSLGSASDGMGSVIDWIDELKKQANASKGAKPNLPAQINLDKYKTEMATIQDIANKYGFDYSREYAEQQAAILAQAQRDEIAAARERQAYESQAAQEELGHDFFKQYLEQRQGLADTGLNAGIAAERDIRLEMNRQFALSDILANEQLSNQEMDRRLATITAEELAYADRLYNERLQQGFGNAMDYSRFLQSENQWQANMAMQQRNQQAEEAWREFQWNNMSASDRMKFIADIEKYGMDQAWERHKFDAGMAFDAGYSGFSGEVKGGSWKSSKGEPPQQFKNHLSAALEATGYPSSWIPAMSELIARESSWNPSAKNPNSTAHGYGQFLNSTRANYEKKYGIKYDNPVNQLILTMHYVKDRYGSPDKAIAFHNKNNWY